VQISALKRNPYKGIFQEYDENEFVSYTSSSSFAHGQTPLDVASALARRRPCPSRAPPLAAAASAPPPPLNRKRRADRSDDAYDDAAEGTGGGTSR
jgi:hypothetical protein